MSAKLVLNTDYDWKVSKSFIEIAIIVFIVLNIAINLYTINRYKSAKKRASIAMEDEDFEAVEDLMTFPIYIMNVFFIVDLVFFGIILDLTMDIDGDFMLMMIGILTLVILTYIILTGVMNNKYIELLKKINPEKRGEYYKLNFNKQWINSCDEGEKYIIYQSGFEAYKIGMNTSMILCFVSIISNLLLKTGVFSIICTAIVYIIMQWKYYKESTKLESNMIRAERKK